MRYGTGDEEKTIVGRVTAGIGRFAIHADPYETHDQLRQHLTDFVAPTISPVV